MKNTQSKHPAAFIGTCVYVHRKATDNSVFYISIGSRNRAMSKTPRNADWQRVASEHGCKVQVVEVFNTPQDAKQAEIEFIDLAKQLGVALTNRSSGGEGGVSSFTTSVDQAVADTRLILNALGKGRKLTSSYQPPKRKPRTDLDVRSWLDAMWDKKRAKKAVA